MGAVADLIDGISIDYAELSGFHVGGVSGHRATMKVGTYGSLEAAIWEVVRITTNKASRT